MPSTPLTDYKPDDIQFCSSDGFIGDPNPSTSNPPGGINLSTSSYNKYTSFMFASCLFRYCKAQNGGGIYLNSGSTVSLSVLKNEFDSSKADPY